jgi:Tfp pilus assembly protein PilF
MIIGSVGTSSASGCGPTRDIKRAEATLDLAKDLLKQHQLDDAEIQAKKALAFDPQDEDAENVLGLIYGVRSQDSIGLVEQQDCLEGDSARTIRAEADDAMRTADKHFKRAVELAPDFGEAMQDRAQVAFYFHDWDQAIDLEKHALEHTERMLPTTGPLARANLGWAYFQKGDFPHAIAELLQATTGQPGYFCLGKFRLASVQFAQSDFDKTLSTLGPWVAPFTGTDEKKVCPPLQDVMYLAGEAYMRTNDKDNAKKMLDACVEQNPKSCQARECDKVRKAL